MRRIHRLFWLFLMMPFCLVGAAHAQLLERAVKGKAVKMPHSVVWGKQGTADAVLKLRYRGRVKPDALVIGRDHPNGVRFLALFPRDGVNLPLAFGKEFGGFDEYGELKRGYFIQAANYDFDGDGEPEIIVAVGDGLTDLAMNVLRFRAPMSPANAGRVENWTRVGSFYGQAKAVVEGRKIVLPVGSQGLFEEYIWSKNGFRRTK